MSLNRRKHSTARSAIFVLVSLLVALGVSPTVRGVESDVAPVYVRVVSASTAGVYRVSWVTLGGCDPGHGTSGMSGEVVLTVEAAASPDSTPSPGELMGTQVAAVVVIQPFCNYQWRVSFVEATTGANCVVGPAPFAPDSNNEIRITLVDAAASCARRSQIVVRVSPSTPVLIDDSDQNAILTNTFVASAEPASDAPKRCSTRSATSRVDENDTPHDTTDDTVSITLEVVDTTLTGEECRYDVTLRVPQRLAIARGTAVIRNVRPSTTIDFSVGVDTKTIFLLQHVVGDSGNGTARYSLSRTCGDPPMLPDPLLPRPSSGGISRTPPVTLVELREGLFNITATLADNPAAKGAADGVVVPMLNNKGEPCTVEVSIAHLPHQCEADRTRLTHELADPPGHLTFEFVVFEFNITCHTTGSEDVDSLSDSAPKPQASSGSRFG